MSLVGMHENGSLNVVNIEMGNKNKYKRIHSDLPEDYDASVRVHQDKDKARTIRKYVLACAFFASLNSVLLGYDVGVMSGAIIFIQEDLKITQVQEEVLVGCLSIVSLFGSLAGGRTSDAVGRKWTIALAAIVFQAGAVVMTLAHSFEMLMAGRLLAGIGIGFGVMIAPVYIAEIAPAVDRGSLTSFPEIFINFGILLGYISNYAFSSLPPHKSWRVMLAVGILPSVLIAVALFIIPESPRWLVTQNRVDEARSVLLKTIESETEVEERLAEIQLAARNEKDQKAVWLELLCPSPAVFKMLVVGIGIQCFQQITGVDALVYYSPEIIKEAGVEDKTKLLAATVAVGITKTIFILFAIFLIDRIGRKPLLYVSTIGMTICLFGLGVTLSFLQKQNFGIALAITLICGDVAFFSVGIGPICWVLNSEIFPLRLRAQAVALGAMGNRVCSGLVAMSFLSLSSAISVSGTFFIFAAVSAISVVFVFTLVPETKGKSLEEIESLFQSNNGQKGAEMEQREGKSFVTERSGQLVSKSNI